MPMSRRVSSPLWPFQKLLILLVVGGLEIITSSNPCNTAWPTVEPGQFRAGEAGEAGLAMERWGAVAVGRDVERQQAGGGRATNYQAALWCWVTNVLLTLSVAFENLNTDLDRTNMRALRSRRTSTHVYGHYCVTKHTPKLRERHKFNCFKTDNK